MEGWVNCSRCGDRYKAFISECPRCGYSNRVKYSERTKGSGSGKKVGIIAGVSVVAVIALFALNMLPLSLNPSNFDRPKPDSSSDNIETEETEEPESPSATDGGPTIELPSLSPNVSIEELREFALERVNKDRADFGLPPVALSDNQAAQIHAEDVFKTQTISHWMTNGEKPYMTYSRLGGFGYVAQNVAVQGYDEDDANACRYGLALCTPVNPKDANDDAEYRMMYDDADADWGHRDNILDKNHTHVSFGIAYDDYYFAFVQNFENHYVKWEQPITYNENTRSVFMSGIFEDGMTFDTINIFFDPLPSSVVYEAHKDDTSYGLGDFVAIVVEPPPPGAYYEETDEYVLIVGEQWRIVGQDLEFSFSMSKLYEKYEKGVYTVVVWGEKNEESISVTNTSLVIDK